MNKVDSLLHKPWTQYSIQDQRKIHKLGPHQPKDIKILNRTQKYTRQFNTDNFDRFAWLTVSENKKTLFCFYCLLFKNVRSLDTWVKTGFSDLAHLSQALNTHAKSVTHIRNAVTFKTFDTRTSIASQIDEGLAASDIAHNNRVRRNRRVLGKIIDCIKFCAEHEIALRGHNEADSSRNRGIFLDLLEREAFNDPELRGHLDGATVVSYTSKDTQNEILDCIFEIYTGIIKDEVKRARFVSVSADEATDISNSSQFVLILRYVIGDRIAERFLKFINIEARNAEGLASIIKEELLPFCEKDKLIAQTYDGATVMSGRISGVQTRVRETFPNAKFVHCYAHQLNLILKQASCGLRPCRIFFSNLQSISVYFSGSPKRNDKLKEQSTTHIPRPSATRWCFQSRLLSSVLEIKEDIINCVRQIQSESGWEDNSLSGACAIEKLLLDEEFLFFLNSFQRLFKHADIVSTTLQARTATLGTASKVIQSFKSSVSTLRREFEEAEDPPSSSRKRIHCSGTELRAAAIDACDIVLNQTLDRFENHKSYQVFDLLQPSEFSRYQWTFPEDLLKDFIKEYPFVSQNKLKIELDVLYREEFLCPPNVITHLDLLKALIKFDLQEDLGEVVVALDIVLTTPTTSAEAERSFSTLKRVKSAARNRMGQQRLNALTCLTIHKELTIDNDLIITNFASRKNRRMELLFK